MSPVVVPRCKDCRGVIETAAVLAAALNLLGRPTCEDCLDLAILRGQGKLFQ